MESSLSAQEDHVISQLDYTLPKLASFVTERIEAVYVPSGAVFRPDGLRLLRIPITSDGFIDASTIVIEASVRNHSATKMLSLSDPSLASMIAEMRVFMSGVEVERVQDYGRLVETLNRGLGMEKRINNADLELEISRSATGVAEGIGFGNDSGYIHPPALNFGVSKTVFHKPLLGICQQKNFIPTWALTSQGLVLEILLCSGAADPLLTDADGALAGDPSQDWSIDNVRLHCDIIKINSQMQNSYASHILSGKSLTIPMRSYTTVRFTNSAEQTLLQIPRTFSRLNSVMVTFYKKTGGPASSSATNYLWAPPDTISTTIQCGSIKFPQNRYQGLKEAYWRYLKGMGLVHSSAHSANVTFHEFSKASFQSHFDLERVPNAPHSGQNTHEGVLTVDIRGLGATPPDLIYVHLFHDLLAEISDGQVVVAL